jgi:hypothetical protein
LVLQGTTTVNFHDSKFDATLVEDTGTVAYHFELSGTINGNRVSAVEEHYQTDADSLTYNGSIERIRQPADQPAPGWGKDRIVVTNGPWVIELFRYVRLTETTP